MDRSVEAGEELNPFNDGLAGVKKVVSTPLMPNKSSKKSKNAKQEDQKEEITVELSNEMHDLLDRNLEVANESMLAANCCLAILVSDRLPKEVCQP